MVLQLTTGLDANRVTQIRAAIAQLKQEFDFFVQLTASDRTSLNAVADARLHFIQAAADVCNEHGSVISMDQEDRDALTAAIYDFEKLSAMVEVLESFMESLKDTTMLAGAICYDKSLLVRTLVELAIRRGKPGMESVYSSLSHLWENSERNSGNGNSNNGSNNNQPVPENVPAWSYLLQQMIETAKSSKDEYSQLHIDAAS